MANKLDWFPYTAKQLLRDDYDDDVVFVQDESEPDDYDTLHWATYRHVPSGRYVTLSFRSHPEYGCDSTSVGMLETFPHPAVTFKVRPVATQTAP